MQIAFLGNVSSRGNMYLDDASVTGVAGNVVYNLLKDGAVAAPGYANGDLYNPGDSASHTYTVQAGSCAGNAGWAFADANGSPGAPSINGIPDVSECAQSGIQVNYTAGSGATSHNLLRNGSVVWTGYTSGATYNPGSTATYTYTVQAVLNSCKTNSTGVPGTDVDNHVGAPTISVVSDVDACATSGVQVVYSAGSPAGTSYNLYKDGTLVADGLHFHRHILPRGQQRPHLRGAVAQGHLLRRFSGQGGHRRQQHTGRSQHRDLHGRQPVRDERCDGRVLGGFTGGCHL